MLIPLGSVIFANGLIVPLEKIELVAGTIQLTATCLAENVVDTFPNRINLEGEYRIHGPDGSLIMFGWGRGEDVDVCGPLDEATFTVTLTVTHDKKSSDWLSHHP